MTLYVGIDDTDTLESRGTGYLARRLAGRLAALGLKPQGVTRHQFLVDDRIPYTSHNSAAAIAFADGAPRAEDVFREAADFVRAAAPPGSDPGLCVATDFEVTDAATFFGRKAQREIVTKDEAHDIARSLGVRLAGLGGSRLGVIGALGAVGLRAEGDDGRFIELAGIRELGEVVTAAELVALGVSPVDWERRLPLDGAERIRTMSWIRPRLIGGAPVLPLRKEDASDEWVTVDRQRGHSRD